MECPEKKVNKRSRSSEAPPQEVAVDGESRLQPSAETAAITEQVRCTWYEWTVVSAQRAQWKRMNFGRPVQIFDTVQRGTIRRQLHRFVDESNANMPSQVFVTGVGGNGKSHNLIQFVMECRGRDHIVAYINTLESCVRDPQIFVTEIEFALNRAIAASSDLREKLVTFEALANVVVDDGSGRIRIDFQYRQYADRRAFFQSFTRLVTSIRDCCASGGKKFVLVADQDNRVQQAKFAGTSPERVANAQLVDDLILGLPFHTTIVSASANNEAWETDKSEWRQLRHFSEPVPQTAATQIYPTASKCDEMRQFVEHDLGGHPLAWKMAELSCTTFPADVQRAIDEVTRTMSNLVLEKLSRFLDNHKDAKDSLNQFFRAVFSPDSRQLINGFERNFWELQEGDFIKPIFPLVDAVSATYFRRSECWNLLTLLPHADPSDAYKLAFWITSEMLTPVATKATRVDLSAAYIKKHDVPRNGGPTCFQTCHSAQCVDFYFLNTDDRTQTTLYVFQLTRNTEHSDSFTQYCTKKQHFLSDMSLAQANQLPFQRLAPSLRTRFVWVTSHDELTMKDSQKQIACATQVKETGTLLRFLDQVSPQVYATGRNINGVDEFIWLISPSELTASAISILTRPLSAPNEGVERTK